MFIPPDHIIPDLRATERFSAIRELLHHLVLVGAIPDQAEESLFAALRRREEVMTTGVGFGYAIPNTSSAAVTERVLAMGQSKNGVNFASIDGKPARIVILMISPKLSKTLHGE